MMTKKVNRAQSLLSCSILGLLGALAIPTQSAACALPNAWFQPTTVQRGDSVLVTGTGIDNDEALMFTFVSPAQTVRFVTLPGNNCVVNQELLDTFNFAKGNYAVTADTISSSGQSDFTQHMGAQLSIVARTTPQPVPTSFNCGQSSHAFFGPTTISLFQQMYIAGVAFPNTTINFFFDNLATGDFFTIAQVNTGSNCVANQIFFEFPQTGTFAVHAGFWDETGHYDYTSVGTLTVTP